MPFGDMVKRYVLGIMPGDEKLPTSDVGMTRGGLVPGGRMERQAAWAAANPNPQPRMFGSPLFAAEPAPNTTIMPKTQTYDTPLSPEEEQQFQVWKAKYAPHDSGADYDLRGAFKAGFLPDPKTGHWPDTFKKPNHPTFSNQSKYAVGADAAKAGKWEGNKFIPPAGTPSKPERNPKRGKTASLDLGDPIIVDAATDLKAMAAAIKSAGDRPVVVRNAMAIGMGSDNVIVAGNKAKADPAKVAKSIATPVVSKQGFVDVLNYIRGR